MVDPIPAIEAILWGPRQGRVEAPVITLPTDAARLHAIRGALAGDILNGDVTDLIRSLQQVDDTQADGHTLGLIESAATMLDEIRGAIGPAS